MSTTSKKITSRELEPVSFLDANHLGLIDCSSRPWEGIRVLVPPIDGAMAGDRVTLDWQGYRSFNGTEPIPETKAEFHHTLAAADLGRAVLFTVGPFDKVIAPIRNGSAIAHYKVEHAGNPNFSPEKLVGIVLELPGGGICNGR
ncbi:MULTISPECIES: hypothetical protein [Pseudomonas]|uniref:Uncharacterized protein n=1 Tax=Pseudomonas gingeri TaxID=117681 RepID=A0A7Y7WQG0_9PSED|nr:MULTISPECIES: hypothetical protein [Pseudomonas]MPQ68843.1 hypothetical protein [Pseudomonas sp. MWU12-2323]NWB84807.1 hypothetical protein [Pseudomonas gingeri]